MTAAIVRDAAAVMEDLLFLDQHRVGAIEAARRCGFASLDALEQWLRRGGNHALLRRLRARDPQKLRGAA